MPVNRGGQLGNDNALRGTMFRDALRSVLASYKTGAIKRKKALHHVAKSLIKKAIGGDIQAIKEIGDRLDGKPAQAIIGPLGEPITLVERVIVVQAIEQPREAIDITDEVEVVQEQIEDKSANTNHI